MKRNTPMGIVALFSLIVMTLIACSDDGSELPDDGDAADGDQEIADGDTPEDGDAPDDGDVPDGDTPDGDEESTDGDDPDDVEALFLQGCPQPDIAIAMEITNPELKMHGPDAVGTVGDMLLMNEKAAFIVAAPENINAYYIYGGILVDAVALDGCKQASPERFEEVGFMMGTLNAAQYESSILRAFKGESIEIINDGSDGTAAIVRVHGVDDYFWLVELELLKASLKKGVEKGLSDPFGLDIAMDYILEPASNVLQIRLTLTNGSDEELSLLVGSEVMFGNTTTLRYYSDDVFSIAGFGLEKGVPWMAASDGDGAWAFSLLDATMSTTNISGVTAILDFNQALVSPVDIAPGEEASLDYLVSVGPTDSNSAVWHLQRYNPEPIPSMPYELEPLFGNVSEASDGSPVAGIPVELQALNGQGDWLPIDSFHTLEDGSFRGKIADFGMKTPEYRLVAFKEGRPDSEPVAVEVGSDSEYEISMPAGGTLSVDIKDDSDQPLPAKILLYREGALAKRIFYVPGESPYPVKPGEYEVSVTRGYEYEVHEGALTINAQETTELNLTLSHLVNTDGYLSVDTHCHAGPSPDNYISIPDRIRTVAGAGLDVVVSTDHEFVADWSPGVSETGLDHWVGTVIGEEVTATLPEHTNAYPLEPRFDINARGGYIPWYGLDIAEIFAAERARGALVTQLNHPRNGNYLTMIGYDPLTGTPTLDDPTWLGFGPDATLWSWDFNTIELMNDPEFIFIDEANPGYKGLFDDWMSFLNFGHSITAIGASDAHNYGKPGRPRNFYPSSTDIPGDFIEDEMLSSLIEGRTLLSAGAFARVLVNDTANMGDLVTDTDGEVDLWLHIEAIPEIDIDYFKVYVNCDQTLAMAADNPDEVIKYDGHMTVPVTEDAHVVVLGFGDASIPRGLGDYNPHGIPRFVTNAIYIDVDGNGVYDPPGGRSCKYDLEAP